MCGIAGIIGGSNIVRESILKILASSLAHRGPDDEGTQLFSVNHGNDIKLGLVHRRLSIIDLSSAAHQPMVDENNGNWIVCNGEIYNYREIRKLLEQKGYIFKSNSDTEVILKAYAFYDKECLEKFRGMFAFAIWDEKKKILFLAVDRFGIKPLYYYKNNCSFLFASEIRALLNTCLIKKEFDEFAINSFLAFGAIQAPQTIIKGISALLPGHYLIYNTNNREISISQYWNLSSCLIDNNSYENRKDKFGEVLNETIKSHLVSDVPLGLFLSGGVDSSAIAILANKVSNGRRLQSFSVVFPEHEYSEANYSRLIGNRFCREHNEIELTESDLYNLLPEALEAMDQPTIDGINTYIISKVVSERGIKTVLSGQGGDEVFGGYNTFRRIPFFRKILAATKFMPISLRRTIAKQISSLYKDSVFSTKLSQLILSDAKTMSIHLILRQLFDVNTRAQLLRFSNKEDLDNDFPIKAKELLFREIQKLDLFNTISALEIRSYLLNMLLRDGDVMGMAHGLEIRVPFLDHELINCIFKIPSQKKVHRRFPKPLLINSVYNDMPSEIYRRPKMGFTFPWELWLRNKMRPQIEELLNNFPINNELGINIKECKKLWNLFLQHKNGITWSRVWAIYVLLKWSRNHILQ